jgi:hypothetical protein
MRTPLPTVSLFGHVKPLKPLSCYTDIWDATTGYMSPRRGVGIEIQIIQNSACLQIQIGTKSRSPMTTQSLSKKSTQNIPHSDFTSISAHILTILLYFLPQRLSLNKQTLHNTLAFSTQFLSTTITLININHGLHNSLQLIRQPSHYRTSSRSFRMPGLLQNILFCKTPMSPSEIADLI